MAKILIIEDDKKFLKYLKYLISDEGHECVECTAADDVLDYWDKLGTIDIIILDLMMKRDKHGKIYSEDKAIETGEIIFNKLRDSYPKKKIIIITAKDDTEIRLDLDKHPEVKVILKPLTESKMQQLLKIL